MPKSTYNVLIAHDALAGLGVKMPFVQIEKELENPNGLYRQLLRPIAQTMKNELVIIQTIDMQTYVQDKLATIVFGTFSLAASKGEADAQGVDTKSGMALTELQNNFEAQAKLVKKSQDEVALEKNEDRQFCLGKIKEWNALVNSGAQPRQLEQFISEVKTQVNTRIPKHIEKLAQCIRGLQGIMSLEESLNLFTKTYVNYELESEMKKSASAAERPELAIEPVLNPGATPPVSAA